MIPILTFKDEETQLVDEGMGRLAETISCSVKEVRNDGIPGKRSIV